MDNDLTYENHSPSLIYMDFQVKNKMFYIIPERYLLPASAHYLHRPRRKYTLYMENGELKYMDDSKQQQQKQNISNRRPRREKKHTV